MPELDDVVEDQIREPARPAEPVGVMVDRFVRDLVNEQQRNIARRIIPVPEEAPINTPTGKAEALRHKLFEERVPLKYRKTPKVGECYICKNPGTIRKVMASDYLDVTAILACDECMKKFFEKTSTEVYPIYKGDIVTDWAGHRCHILRTTFVDDYVTGEPIIFTRITVPPKLLIFENDMEYPPEKTDIKYTAKPPANSCPRCLSAFTGGFKKEIIEKLVNVLGDNSLRRTCPNCLSRILPLQHEAIKRYTVRGVTSGLGRTVGIEIECEPSAISQADIYAWRTPTGSPLLCASTDNSLRGHWRVEYKTPIISESDLDGYLSELSKRLKANVYSRCGLHIHLGSEDFSWYDVSNILRYCTIYEPIFMSFVAPSRSENAEDGSGRPLRLPLSYTHVYRSKSDFLSMLYGPKWNHLGWFDQETGKCPIKKDKRANDQHGQHYDGAIHRYQWLNVHSHFHQRTIEVRLHHGTANCTKIRNWCHLWLQLLPKIADPRNINKHPLSLVSEDIKAYYSQRQKVLGRSCRELQALPLPMISPAETQFI